MRRHLPDVEIPADARGAAIALGNDMPGLAIGLFVLAAVTDVLDGYLARRLDEVSEFGKIIDPLADKVFVGVIVVHRRQPLHPNSMPNRMPLAPRSNSR